ncbi:helix-hairpin-helix domain-containing protein [Geobacter pickeringii]|uniref:DNA-binding protein n=1 Tax=Geobacter pickeringii TaxID=345632 RepID=A0A0B5BGF3_9BACT|nr:helix-hairpin-helix domain-containing protein [Geobacter pickeringii]AJE03121.1 DNA-binding protein [Geobacter pickeringii]
MKKEMKELQRIKGIGDVLARRFVEAGLGTFESIVAAGSDGIGKIKGVPPRAIQNILEQAVALAGEGSDERAKRVEQLKGAVTTVKEQVEGIAKSVRERFSEELAGKGGKKIEKDILKLLSSLEKVEGKLETRMKRAGKGLAKAEKRLAGLAEAGLKGIGKGLKKSRKSLKRVIA